MTLKIGLTGGIGSGKTTIANLFAKLKIDIIDTDLIAHELVQPNTPILKKIIHRFSESILNQNRSLNRQKLASIIFSSPKQKKWLEDLLHPLIWQTVQKKLTATTSAYVIIIVPLLIETACYKKVDRILVVDIDEETQLQRLLNRDGKKRTLVDIKKIIASQCSRATRLAYADDIIDNTDHDQAITQVKLLNEKYCDFHDKLEEASYLQQKKIDKKSG